MVRPTLVAFALLSFGAVAACSTTVSGTPNGSSGNTATGCKADTECSGTPTTPRCDASIGKCVATAPAGEVGKLLPANATFTEISVLESGVSAKISDLAFHLAKKNELWVLGEGDDSTYLGIDMDTEPKWTRYLDPARRHFMHQPLAIAMGDMNDWATCGNNDNRQNTSDQVPNYFMGPALFSADLSIFAKRTSGGLGSHIDMLHQTPFCRGISHIAGRDYWVFNAYDNSLDRYKFHTPHEPGGDDHSDGEIFQYAMGKVKGAIDNTPSHIFYDSSDGFLYVADTGNARIVKLDTTKGSITEQRLQRQNEPLAGQGIYGDTDVEVVVPEGVVAKPSGLEIIGDNIYVTDPSTSEFIVFDKAGKELHRLKTDLPEGSLAGFAIGPDQKIWFVDRTGGRVMRIDGK